jgi:hypothetical protein
MSDRKLPGYMTEDLQPRVISGPPNYGVDTDKPIEHITLTNESDEVIGYIYANDEDDVAAWQLHYPAGHLATNLVPPWNRMLSDAKQRGLKPTQALDELERAPTPANKTKVVSGSRTKSSGTAALRALAQEPPPRTETDAPRGRGRYFV